MDGRDDLPAGIVTFVFTDIEGSTRLVRSLGDGYPPVLDRHREILRAEWDRHRGHEIDTEGDSFFVAFAAQRDAIAACVDGQRRLEREQWPDGIRVRVRMGIHSGLAVPHGHDYVALAVHQAARVVNTAHGGQIIVSADAATRSDLPPDVSLRSLGLYRVRDFDDPLELWQVVAPDLDDSFPALRTLPADRHNLVTPLTPIIGREGELRQLASAVQPAKVVTVVGPGGAGKTRLAVEHGLRALDVWRDGVWFVDMAVLDDGALTPAAIAGALGLRAAGGGDVSAAVVDRLDGQRALLILDNAEHVRESTARIVAAVLGHCADVGFLVTSREPLGLRAENVVRLGPLAWTSGGGDVAAQPAVQLFLARAAEAGATRLGSIESVARLCGRVDGLPLAIEMAAARAAILTADEILAGLEDTAAGFRSRDPTVAQRHRSLDDLLAWSDDLLTRSERTALRRLAAFIGRFGYEGALAAAAGSDVPAAEVPELVWTLANKSLLDVDPAAGATRYRFPETVRTYARHHDPEDDVHGAANALARWYLASVGPGCPLDRTWIGRMGEELDNVRGVIALVAQSRPDDAQQLAWSIGMRHDLVQEYRYGVDEIDRYVTALDAPTPSRVGLLSLLADLRLRIGDTGRATAALAEARGLQAEVGPPPWDDVAVERTEGELEVASGDLQRAIRLATEALQRPLSPRGRGRMLNLLGVALYLSGDYRAAAAACERELEVLGAVGLEAMQVSTHGNIAESLLRSGDRAGAARHQGECLRLALRHGQPVMMLYSMMVAARLACEDDLWATAVRLQSAADVRLTEIGVVMYAADREAADGLLANCAERLDAQTLAEEQHRGSTDDLDALLATTEEILDGVARASTGARRRSETHV